MKTRRKLIQKTRQAKVRTKPKHHRRREVLMVTFLVCVLVALTGYSVSKDLQFYLPTDATSDVPIPELAGDRESSNENAAKLHPEDLRYEEKNAALDEDAAITEEPAADTALIAQLESDADENEGIQTTDDAIVVPALEAPLLRTLSTSECDKPLQAHIDEAAPGATVIVPPCTYRESVVLTKPITLIGQDPNHPNYPNNRRATILGSDDWSSGSQQDQAKGGWQEQDGYWIHAGLRAFNYKVPARCNNRDDHRCKWPHQLFIDGVPQTQVADNPKPGEFSVGTEPGKRYVKIAINPHQAITKANGATSIPLIEVSTRTFWIKGKKLKNVTIEGFIMRHASNHRYTAAIGTGGGMHWKIANNIMSDTNGGVIAVTGAYNKVVRNDISRGGFVGVTSGKGFYNSIKGNYIHDNNTENHLQIFGSGGIKLAGNRLTVIAKNRVYNNLGNGIWCDIFCDKVLIRKNRVFDNVRKGIVYEISTNGRIVDNVVYNNALGLKGWGPGIICQHCAGTEINNNIVGFNKDQIAVLQYHNKRVQVKDNNVHDNVILHPVRRGRFALGWTGGTPETLYNPEWNNRSSCNRFWLSMSEGSSDDVGEIPIFAWEGAKPRLADVVVENTANCPKGTTITTQQMEQLVQRYGMKVNGVQGR